MNAPTKGPARALPIPDDAGDTVWTPMCPTLHDGALWMGASSYTKATADLNAALHNTHRHPAPVQDQGVLW